MDTPKEPPFGTPIFWGPRGCGKTLTSLNSPWQPVHVIDVEDGAKDYEQHMDRLIDMKYIPGKFTRTFCPNELAWRDEVHRITGRATKDKPAFKSTVHYGTIVIDTVGQVGDWIASAYFAITPNSDKISQIVWGKVRGYLRSTILDFKDHADFVILTAHQREFMRVFSPRANPALLELTSLSIKLDRPVNTPKPNAVVVYSRLPFIQPAFNPFSWEALLKNVEKPVDWNNLQEDQKAPPPPPPMTEEEIKVASQAEE